MTSRAPAPFGPAPPVPAPSTPSAPAAGTRGRSRLLLPLGLALLAAALWWARDIAAAQHLFAGTTLGPGLNAAAALALAALAVTLAGQALTRLVLHAIYGIDSTGFQRAGLYAVLAAAAAAAVLTHLGVDVTAVLATSAILTVILGLALQPTLGGLIGGLSLHTDRLLRIGDAVLENAEPAEVVAFNWRSVSARRLDGSTVVLPNARIVDRTIEILPRDRPVRADIVFPAPITVPPQRLSDLLVELVADLDAVDAASPVIVAPIAFDADHAVTQYRIRCWVHAWADRSNLQAEILHRVWYALQREAIAWPVSTLYAPAQREPQHPSELLGRDWPRAVADAIARARDPSGPAIPAFAALPEPAASSPATLRPALPRPILPHAALHPGGADALAASGIALFYPAMERIVLPARAAGCLCLLVDGRVRETASEHAAPPADGPAGTADVAGGPFARRIALARLTGRLADIIGPYAELAVQRAAEQAPDLRALCETVAAEIDDPARRRSFIEAAAPPVHRGHGPGSVFRLRRDASGSLVTDPALRATQPCAFLAFPAAPPDPPQAPAPSP